jgi:muramoyltetrapeptide carboxypeptidase
VLPLLEGWHPEKNPKLFIGYSDTTSILTWLTCHRGITALHGPMLDGRLARGPSHYDPTSFLSLVSGLSTGLDMAPAGLCVVKAGEAEGRLFGGTLTQLAASLGTPYAFRPPDNSILFIEDVNERPYRIDRLLTQLRQSGALRTARALVFGEMRGCDEAEGTPTALDVIQSLAIDFPGPVLFGFPSGHTTGPCWTLPLGARVRVRTGPTALLRVEESPVA